MVAEAGCQLEALLGCLLEPGLLGVVETGEEHQALQEGNYLRYLQQPAQQDLLLGSAGSGRARLVGVAALQLFVKVNWLGGELDGETYWPDWEGEELRPGVREAGLLQVARSLLLEEGESHSGLVPIWALRAANVTAAVLEEPSDLLQTAVAGLMERAGLHSWDNSTLHALFLLETARFQRQHHRVREAGAAVVEAAGLARLSLVESGALGRRTRFQTRDIPQFCLELSGTADPVVRPEIEPTDLARDIKLEDEVRLDRIEWAGQEAGEGVRPRLNGLQQAILLAFCWIKLTGTKDELTPEQALPYLEPVLEHPAAWAVHTAALLARSQLEAEHSKTVERSMAQLDCLLESVRASGQGRLQLLHPSQLPPLWEVEARLGCILLSVGSTKAALEIFLRLEDWERAVACYTLLGFRHRAAELIRARLAERETARLWCELGDATDDLDCYHTALKLSDGRSARAHRSLGLRHYADKEYEEAVPLFERSLNQCGCQPGLLLRLAYAAMQLERWELAAQSYRNYCSYEQDSFEAWNNLANCYIKLGQKERAWRVLHEATRCDFDNWKVWDNLLVVATDIGEFEDAIRSYNRVLDLQPGHVDNAVLSLLTRAVREELPERTGTGAGRLRPRMATLLARLTVAAPREWTPWSLAASLHAGQPGEEAPVKAVQSYQRGLAAVTGGRGWDKDPARAAAALQAGLDLAAALPAVTGPQQLSLCSSARLSLASAATAVERGQASAQTGQLEPGLAAKLAQLRTALAELTARTTQLRSEQQS